MEKENCRMHEQASRDSLYQMRGHLMDIHGPGRDWRRNKRLQDPTMWPDIWKHMSDASKRKEKQKWAIEKPKLDSARRLRGIFFIEFDDEEFKRIMKNARRKLEIPMPAAMLCRLQLNLWQICTTRRNMLLLLKPTNLWGYTWKGLWEKSVNSVTYFCAQIYSYAWRHEHIRCKGSSGRRKLEKILARQLTKVKNKSEVIDEARTKDHTVHFASFMDLCHLKNSELEPQQFQKYKGRVVLRGGIVKDDSGSYAVFTEQGSSYQDYQDVQDKQQMQYPRIPRVKMEDAPSFLQIPISECPNIWIRPPRHKWPESWSQNGRPSRSSWTKSIWSSFGRAIMGKAIWEKFFWNTNGNVYSLTEIHVCARGRYQNGRKETKSGSNVEILMKDVDLAEPTSFLDHVYLGCIQRECQISKDIVYSYRSMFGSRISAGAMEKYQ